MEPKLKCELTPWFERGVKPRWVGVYETDANLPTTITYQHWNGKFWGMFTTTPQRAVCGDYRNIQSQHNPKWRGLAKQP